MCLFSARTLQWKGGKGLEWLIQRTDIEQRKQGPNEWVEEVLNGIRGTCIVFWRHRDDLLLLSRCIRSVLQLYFVFLSIFPAFVFCTLETRWLAHPLSESSDSNYHLLSPNNPTIQKKRIQRNRICYSSSAQCFLFSPYIVVESMFCAFQQFRLSSFISRPATLSPESFLSSRRTLQ